MSGFEFFFSFYGLLLGLSVAVIATGVATAIQHRKRIRIGYLTPLLAVFVMLDIASFWDQAWNNFRDLPFSYGLLVAGLFIALVYFIAASLVFPHDLDDGASLDDHFWANKKVVLFLLVVANALGLSAAIAANLDRAAAGQIIGTYAVLLVIYMAITVPAALARRPRLVVVMLGLHVVLYLVSAVGSALHPEMSALPTGPTAAPSSPAAGAMR
ncbi:MAG TPA: hypothetical protein VGB49_04575 [Caulobacteraceae bacterium]|jgi:hypothetical protein